MPTQRRSRALWLVLIAVLFTIWYLTRPDDLSRRFALPHGLLKIAGTINLDRRTRRDGRLTYNDGESHPIPHLMRRARQQWTDLQARQSKTFRQTVDEYRRRYKREPPPGFDKWYAYARQHRVLLIDEFDLIKRDLAPFRAFSPRSFRARVQHLVDTVEFGWTIHIQGGRVQRGGSQAHGVRARGVEQIVKTFAQHRASAQVAQADGSVPDGLTAVYFAHDGAAQHISHEERTRLASLVQAGRYDDDSSEMVKKSSDPTRFRPRASPDDDWPIPQACPPGSLMREPNFDFGEFGGANFSATGHERAPIPDDADSAVIASFKQYLDVCNNPDTRRWHASTSFVHAGGNPPVLPLFTPGVFGPYADVHAVLLDGLDMLASYQAIYDFTRDVPHVNHAVANGRLTPAAEHVDDVSWHDKPFSRVAWRGQTSGMVYSKHTPWRATSVRARLHLLSRHLHDERELMIADSDGIARKQSPTRNKVLNPSFLDAAMAGEPVQCADEADDRTCDELRDEFTDQSGRMSEAESHLYKYVIDIDGNAWSGRFRRLMLSRSMVLKATGAYRVSVSLMHTVYSEFWTDWIVPWLHFVPVAVDYSDLHDTLGYFRGDVKGNHAHDAEAQEIAEAGRKWAIDCFRFEDIVAYTFRLYLEYARLWDEKRADYVGPIDHEPS